MVYVLISVFSYWK